MNLPHGKITLKSSCDRIDTINLTRSLGDLKAKDLGNIPDPEISEYTIQEDDRFLVLFSDGLSNRLLNDTKENYYPKACNMVFGSKDCSSA